MRACTYPGCGEVEVGIRTSTPPTAYVVVLSVSVCPRCDTVAVMPYLHVIAAQLARRFEARWANRP